MAPNISSQSIVIQKSKPIPQSPVNIAISGAKHTLATYNKPSTVAKVQENQSILVTSNAPPATANQKFFLTPKNVPKISQNTKYNYPSAIAAKGPVINFQIANGQLQDPQGNVTVMQDTSAFTSPTSEIPPLLPISKNIASIVPSSVTLTNAAIHTPSSVTDTSFSASLPTNDNTFPTSIPGSRAELIGEKEYALSIPESNTSLNDDMYTVSITEDNDSLPENYTISITEKGNTLLGNNLTSVEAVLQEVECNLSSQGPTILRRSNSDSIEKKIILNEKRRISLCSDDKKCNDDIENKIEKAKLKLFNQNLTILNKPILETVEESKLPSLFCEEKFDHEVEIKVVEKPKPEPPVKNNGFSNLIRNPQINKDRRKSRLSADNYNITQNNALDKISDKTVFQFPHLNKDTSKTDFLTEEDSLGLQWKNDIALLNGSCLQFHTNEFGLIDIIDAKDSAISLTKYHAPLKQRINRDKKPSSPEDLYCCDGCGCHGMAAEFITPNFCSHTCQRNFRKNHNSKKERETFDFRKKRRQKKTLIQKLKPKERSNSLSENNAATEESKLLESISSDVTITTTSTPIHAVKSNSTEAIKTPVWKCDKVGFSWLKYLEYYKGKAAPPNLFREKESLTNKNYFKIGMKVEAIDPVHPSLFAVVTITEVQGYRLKLHFDGYHEDYDFWVNADSCDIFPPGWCEKNGRVLRPPMGFTPSCFSWPLYLKQVRAIAAPKNLFAHVSTSVSIFKN